MEKLLGRGTTKLFTAASSKSEYKSMLRTLTGENTSTDLNAQMVNDALLSQTCKSLSNAKEIYVLHDPSDIRKPHSTKAGNLGKVRALTGDIINGYSTHNAVAIAPSEKAVHLLSHVSYSNADPKFLKRKFIDKIKRGVAFEGDLKAKQLYETNDFFNKKTLSVNEIKKIGCALKTENNSVIITHILDREFDDDEYLNLIEHEMSQNYVIRSKKSRSLDERDEGGKKKKLIDADFSNQGTKLFKKFSFGRKCTQDAKATIQWDTFDGYNAVKITVSDRKGNPVFTDSMLLLTNKKINSLEDAYQIYLTYLKRTKIEYVFKFLKEGLGWEEFQIQDFKAIQKLLSICFYVASYLYEIGKDKAYDDYAILLADLGSGKGRVTRHFITIGIRRLLEHYCVARILKDRGVSKARQDDMRGTFEISL